MAAALPVDDVSFSQLSEEGKLEDFIIGQLLSDLDRNGSHQGEFGARFSDPEEETGWQSEGQDIYAKPRYYFTAWPVEALTRMNDDNAERMESLRIVREALTRRLGRGFIKIKVNWAPPGEKATTVLDNYRHTIKGADLLLTMREGQPTVQNIVSRIMDHQASMQNSDGGWAQWSDMLTESDLWASSYAARFLHRYIQSGWFSELMGEVTAHQRNLKNRLDDTLQWLENQWRADKWTYGKKLPWVSSAPLVYAEIVSCLKERSAPFLLEPVHAFMELLDASGYIRPTNSGLAASQEISDYRLAIWICFCLGNVADKNPEARAYCERLWMHLLDRGQTTIDIRTYEWAFLLLMLWADRSGSGVFDKHMGQNTPQDEVMAAMESNGAQERYEELWRLYCRNLPDLFVVSQIDSIVAWLMRCLGPVYARIRIYWYDGFEGAYYSLASTGMDKVFEEKFNIDLETERVIKKYVIPWAVVPYQQSPMPVLLLNRSDLHDKYGDIYSAPEYYKDIFHENSGVEQTLTIEIPDTKQGNKPIGAVSIDLGDSGYPFDCGSSHMDQLGEQILLSTIIRGEWGAKFGDAVNRVIAAFEHDESFSPGVYHPQTGWKDVKDNFYAKHQMGSAYKLSDGRSMIYNAAVAEMDRPLCLPLRYIDRFIRSGQSTRDDLVLISETTCGKELFARALKEYSGVSGEFISINTPTIPDKLYQFLMEGSAEDALDWGVRKGPGKFKLAENGIILLDNVHKMCEENQSNMLRNLREKEINVYGGTVEKVQFFAILTCNGNPKTVATFNKDFNARLGMLQQIRLPPLRERQCDLIVLLAHCAGQFNREHLEEIFISGRALKALIQDEYALNFATLFEHLSRQITEAELLDKKELTIDVDDLWIRGSPITTGSGWQDWIGDVTDDERIQILPWKGLQDPVEDRIPREDGAKQTAAKMYERIVHNEKSFANLVPIPKGTCDQTYRDWKVFLALMQVAKEEGFKNRTATFHIFTSTVDERISKFASALGITTAEAKAQVDAVFSQGSDAN